MNRKIECVIDAALDGRKVRYILRNHLGISAGLVRRLKSLPDGILLNGAPTHQNETVKTGDSLLLTVRDKMSENIVPSPIEIEVLYEDKDILVVNKPGNMPTHPSQNHHDDTLANAVMYRYREEEFTFRVITRLDRETSGVVLIAKNALSAQKLANQMQNGCIEKEYIAAVSGVPNAREGCINAPIGRQADSVILRCVNSEGKTAETEYSVLTEKEGLSLLRVVPKTGRTHQIRVHLKSIGTPIFGDGLYGEKREGERTRLHCRSIAFSHPMKGETMKVEAPVPKDILSLFPDTALV